LDINVLKKSSCSSINAAAISTKDFAERTPITPRLWKSKGGEGLESSPNESEVGQ
jgi:hypothetical protein